MVSLPLLVLFWGTLSLWAEAFSTISGPALTADPVLMKLIEQARTKRPEFALIQAKTTALEERAPQSGVLPDPVLSLGIQNDGFDKIQIGKMESSYVQVMASQTFPWINKRGLRREVATIDARVAQTELERVRLSITAEIERAYVDLIQVRDQLGLLTRLESLWAQSEGLARARYEAGETSQSDWIRAQLERSRLKRDRWSLEGEERRRVIVLNRVSGQNLSAPRPTTRSLLDLPDPILPSLDQAVAAVVSKSPELKRAQWAEVEASRRVDLAKRERWPDVTVSFGVMPRGGEFVTMWQAGVAMNVPIWSHEKQKHAILENQARGQAAVRDSERIRQLLQQRVHERWSTLAALLESTHLYRSGLLIQSEATVKSTLSQYQVGRVSFATVLESLAGYLNDVNGFLGVIAAAQQIAIAEREMSLDAPGGGGTGRGGDKAMPAASGIVESSIGGKSMAGIKDGNGTGASMSGM